MLSIQEINSTIIAGNFGYGMMAGWHPAVLAGIAAVTLIQAGIALSQEEEDENGFNL